MGAGDAETAAVPNLHDIEQHRGAGIREVFEILENLFRGLVLFSGDPLRPLFYEFRIHVRLARLGAKEYGQQTYCSGDGRSLGLHARR